MEDPKRLSGCAIMMHGVIEKADNVLCIPIDVDWNDAGSRVSLEGVRDCGNGWKCKEGRGCLGPAKNSMVSSRHKLTTLIGAEDLIVVDSPETLT